MKQSPSGLMWAGNRSQMTMRKALGNSQAQAVIAAKGADVFQRSKGCSSEAMKGNVSLTLLLSVDGQKLTSKIWPRS